MAPRIACYSPRVGRPLVFSPLCTAKMHTASSGRAHLREMEDTMSFSNAGLTDVHTATGHDSSLRPMPGAALYAYGHAGQPRDKPPRAVNSPIRKRMAAVETTRDALRLAISRTDVEENESEAPWNVRAVFAGDNSSNKCGVVLAQGTIYASSGMHGGADQFWKIFPLSLRVADQGSRIVSWSTSAVTDHARNAHVASPPPAAPRVDLTGVPTQDTRMELLVRLLAWCLRNPGIAVIIGGPGSRCAAPGLSPHHILHAGSVPFRGGSGMCVEKSLLNGLAVIGEAGLRYAHRFNEEIKRFAHSGSRVSLTGLGSLQHVINGCAPVFERKPELRRVPKAERSTYEKNRYQYFIEHARGVWLVRLVQSGVVDHCVTVDCTSAVIYDSAEQYPVPLSEDVLRLCGGSDASDLRIAEARMLTLQASSRKRSAIKKRTKGSKRSRPT